VVKVASINELAISYLRAHLADALIAATAWKKNLKVAITNPRHFTPLNKPSARKTPRHRCLSSLWEERIVSEKVPIASAALSA
jgi:hypothetical protein